MSEAMFQGKWAGQRLFEVGRTTSWLRHYNKWCLNLYRLTTSLSRVYAKNALIQGTFFLAGTTNETPVSGVTFISFGPVRYVSLWGRRTSLSFCFVSCLILIFQGGKLSLKMYPLFTSSFNRKLLRCSISCSKYFFVQLSLVFNLLNKHIHVQENVTTCRWNTAAFVQMEMSINQYIHVHNK